MARLKDYLAARPDQEEVSQLFSELREDGPRGAAMVAGALIDDVLLGAIKYRLKNLSDANELFDPDRPLGTFSARIKIAFALGIFGPKTRHDLDTFRRIRNAFAHTRRAVTFDIPEIAALCQSFHCRADIENHEKASPRELFVGAAQILMIYLVTKIGPFPNGKEIVIEGLTSLD